MKPKPKKAELVENPTKARLLKKVKDFDSESDVGTPVVSVGSQWSISVQDLEFMSLRRVSKEGLIECLSSISEALKGETSRKLKKDGVEVVLFIWVAEWLKPVREVIVLTESSIKVSLKAVKKLLRQEAKHLQSGYKLGVELPDELGVGRKTLFNKLFRR
jgi:hypothetical protein